MKRSQWRVCLLPLCVHLSGRMLTRQRLHKDAAYVAVLCDARDPAPHHRLTSVCKRHCRSHARAVTKGSSVSHVNERLFSAANRHDKRPFKCNRWAAGVTERECGFVSISETHKAWSLPFTVVSIACIELTNTSLTHCMIR